MSLSEGHPFLAAHPLSFVIFCLLPPFRLIRYCLENFFLLLQKMVGRSGTLMPPSAYAPDILNYLSKIK